MAYGEKNRKETVKKRNRGGASVAYGENSEKIVFLYVYYTKPL
jgi:hypothetical protein